MYLTCIYKQNNFVQRFVQLRITNRKKDFYVVNIMLVKPKIDVIKNAVTFL